MKQRLTTRYQYMGETHKVSAQRVAESVQELQDSYDRLYRERLGEHKSTGQARLMLDLADVREGRLLDVACGLGYLVQMAEARGATAYGVDLSAAALGIARAETGIPRLLLGNGERLPWQNDAFDYVMCQGSLEHFINPDLGVREIGRVLKPDGRAVILLPNSHHLQAIYNVYKFGGILPELQDFERFGTRVEWQALLESNGLRVLAVHKHNVGLSRIFRKGREVFWFVFNALYKLLGDVWIPTNLSFSLVFVCCKADVAVFNESPPPPKAK